MCSIIQLWIISWPIKVTKNKIWKFVFFDNSNFSKSWRNFHLEIVVLVKENIFANYQHFGRVLGKILFFSKNDQTFYDLQSSSHKNLKFENSLIFYTKFIALMEKHFWTFSNILEGLLAKLYLSMHDISKLSNMLFKK